MAFRICMAQLEPAGHDARMNREIGLEACRAAKAGGADLILFPEMWSSGYGLPDEFLLDADPRTLEAELKGWKALAIGEDDPFIEAFRSAAEKFSFAVGMTYLEKRAPSPRNSFMLIDGTGRTALRYSKVHTCDFGVEKFCAPGDGFPVCDLRTDSGAVRLGAMICFDREFPEPARILALAGAEILLVPNACELEIHRIEQLRTRAFENMVGIAVANYPAPKENGHSLAVRPQAFGASGESLAMMILEAPESPGLYYADFDMDAIRAYRKKEPWGSKHRKPELYGRLVE
jgi:predicted amidohydrolase